MSNYFSIILILNDYYGARGSLNKQNWIKLRAWTWMSILMSRRMRAVVDFKKYGPLSFGEFSHDFSIIADANAEAVCIMQMRGDCCRS